MRSLLHAAFMGAVALTALAAAPAEATRYKYGYTFDTGDTASGYFTGTGPITDITGISDVSLKIDGAPIPGVSAYSYTGYTGPNGPNCQTCYTNSGAVVSSNPLAENFLFSNGSKYFYIIPWNNGPGNQVASQARASNGYIDYYNGQYIPSNFSVSPAPEASTWALMLVGFGLAGAGLRRRSRLLAVA